MNIPKPGPPVIRKTDFKPSAKIRKVRFTVEFTNGDTIDVVAVDQAEALKVAFDKRQEIPLGIKKAPFVPTDGLRQRPFRDSTVLQELRKTLTKENNRG